MQLFSNFQTMLKKKYMIFFTKSFYFINSFSAISISKIANFKNSYCFFNLISYFFFFLIIFAMQCCFSKNDISYLLRVLIRDSMQFVYLNRQIFLSSPVGVTSQRYMYSYWELSEEDFTQARFAFKRSRVL